ncbi:MAG TPA: S1C family serine protease [Thermoleophilaceae bacterium]|nr:S1C family serine protease [Thermoleophilaceae bacterium]
MADEQRIDPEEDPEAALEALAEGRAPETPARRRRLARAALFGMRDARRSARIGIGVGALALAVALGIGVLALTRDTGDEGGGVVVTDDIAAGARSGTIYVRSRGVGQESVGTGVLVDAAAGLVLTNFHVIALGGDLQAGEPDRLDDAEIRAAAPCEDLALLEVEGVDDRTAITLGRQGDVAQGDPVVALGYPVSASGGKSLTTTAGVVSTVRTPLRLPAPDQPRLTNLVQTDAALGAGNSGGPLVGADGRLVGVNTILFTGAADAPSADQGYAIGVDRVRELLADFREGRSRAWFGAGLLTPPPGVLARERLPAGILATSAQDGTSAAELRLEEVLITAIGGTRVGSSLASYCEAVSDVESGESRDITVIAGPGGREQTMSVEFD